RTSHVRPYFRNRQTRFVELMSGRPMNGAVDATPAKHPLVRGVDDGVNVELRDVAPDNFDQGRNRGRATGRPGHGMEIIISTSPLPKNPIASRCLRSASAAFRILTRPMCTRAMPAIMPI